jgi:hypothetical protein
MTRGVVWMMKRDEFDELGRMEEAEDKEIDYERRSDDCGREDDRERREDRNDRGIRRIAGR